MKSCYILIATLIAMFGPSALLAAPATEATIRTSALRLTLSGVDGRCEIIDTRAGVAWRADGESGLGRATILVGGKPRQVQLKSCNLESSPGRIAATFHLIPELPTASLRIVIQSDADAKALGVSYEADPALQIQSISLLSDTLAVTDSARGYVLVPVREGLLIPADSGLQFSHRFDTSAYEGCHMGMLGLVQNGAAALLTWNDPYVAAEIQSTTNHTSSHHQKLSPSLVLSKSAKSFQLRFLGKGDHVTLARAYREEAKRLGRLVTWDQKLKENPERAKLFGAINYKLWSTLDRRMNEASKVEESKRVNWTFEEAAQVAEHLKHDLKLDKVLFTMGGWIHRGYDNQHPDILPTAPECGGDEAFADCARRIMALGYVLSLHDNYQDIYRDSPSWDEKLIMKTADGTIARGGHWAGGLAYLTCSITAFDLARRPQNLAAVKRLSGANSYFIDTTYASGLQECFDPEHPLKRGDDIKWKQALSDYAREVFGIFGSECGREWAIPHSDFFEGLTGVSGGPYHDAKLLPKLGATVVPLFELVYRDCIAMYGKYGYDPERAASYVLHHISLGRPLNYHKIPAHLYWKQGEAAKEPSAQTNGSPALFTQSENGWTAGLHPMDRFVKNTYEILSPLNEITSRLPMTKHEFLSPDRKVEKTRFGEGGSAVTVVVNQSENEYACDSRLGGRVSLPANGFLVESPTFAAFHATSWNGLKYDAPVLFTLRSTDKRSLAKSKSMRVYHAFGSAEVRVGKANFTVQREDTVGGSRTR